MEDDVRKVMEAMRDKKSFKSGKIEDAIEYVEVLIGELQIELEAMRDGQK